VDLAKLDPSALTTLVSRPDATEQAPSEAMFGMFNTLLVSKDAAQGAGGQPGHQSQGLEDPTTS